MKKEFELKVKKEQDELKLKNLDFQNQITIIEEKIKSLLLIQDNKSSMTSDYIQKHIEETENLLNKDLKYPNDEKFQNISLFFKKIAV